MATFHYFRFITLLFLALAASNAVVYRWLQLIIVVSSAHTRGVSWGGKRGDRGLANRTALIAPVTLLIEVQRLEEMFNPLHKIKHNTRKFQNLLPWKKENPWHVPGLQSDLSLRLLGHCTHNGNSFLSLSGPSLVHDP